jgi:3-dehydroquinate dehydratase type I
LQIRRDISDIETDLNKRSQPIDGSGSSSSSTSGDAARPAYAGGESLAAVYARRAPWYAACASHAFYIAAGDGDWPAIGDDFCALVARLARSEAVAGRPTGSGSGGGSNEVPAPAAAASLPTAGGARLPPVVRTRDAVSCTGWPSNDSISSSEVHSLPCGANDGTSFVCLALSDIRQIGGASASVDAAASSGRLTFPSGAAFDAFAAALHVICRGTDAVELRVDVLIQQLAATVGLQLDANGQLPQPVVDYIAFTLALLRRGLWRGAVAAAAGASPHGRPLPHVPRLPIIYTVRSAAEGGVFGVNPATAGDGSSDIVTSGLTPAEAEAEAAYLALTRLGVRLGAEAVDVEAGRGRWAAAPIASLAAAARAQGVAVIASAHFPAAPPPPAATVAAAARACASAVPAAAAVKLVAAASCPADVASFAASLAHARRAAAPLLAPPAAAQCQWIGLAMGEGGRLSRVLNDQLTPVTAEGLPTAAAPGQLTLPAIRSLRHQVP